MLSKILNKRPKSSLDSLFYPRSIAVIGASNDKDKIGGYIFSQILKKKTIKAYPINVKWSKVQNVKAYPNVEMIDEIVDLVVIAIPAKFVLDNLKIIVKKGIKNVVIISAGFKETGEKGRKLENEIKVLAHKNNINLIGPNCLGFLNAEIDLNCSFAKDIPEKGDIALISQSGAVIDAIIDWSFKKNIGFSKIVSMGNMAGVSQLDILNYLKNDTKTKSIVFYMETLDEGEEFSKVLKEVTKIKPVIIIKPGNSSAAKNAIGSHTGSLAQDNVLVSTLIKESNGILVENINELYNVIQGLSGKLQKNNNLIILTNAGGPGVIATDSLEKSNYNLYKFSDNEKRDFDFLPNEASLNNPIDILGDAKSDRYINTLKEIDKIDDISNVLILLTPQIMTDSENIARDISNFNKKSKKNISVCFLGEKEVSKGIKILDKYKVPNFQTPSDAIFAMNKMYKYYNFNYNDEIQSYKFDSTKIRILKSVFENKKGLLDYETTKQVMDVLAIGVPEKIIIKDLLDISNVQLDKNKKYVMKADSKELIHKLDVGGVQKDITIHNFKEKAHEMFDILFEKVDDFTITLEEQVSGTEVIVGLKQDESLGNFIMFGMGGTFVNIYKDISWSKCPLSKTRSKRLVESTKVFEILNGFRGTHKINFKHLYEIIIRISYIQEIFPEITEVDFNPIICDEKGIYLVDIKLIV